jgi:hypothetical protein
LLRIEESGGRSIGLPDDMRLKLNVLARARRP